MSKKFLLREYYALCEGGVCQDMLTEEEKRQVREENVVFLTGKLQEADLQNGNGRIYPKTILEREIKNYKKLVKEMRALGELDHPESSVINLQNCSHVVTEVWMDGPSVMGKIKVLNTPSGKILNELINGGVQVGISSRGLGSVKEQNGKTMVEDDFQLICFDIVSDPSTPGAFMNLTENKDPVNKIFTKADRINRILNDILVD
tara:strand:- start:890 stop:1501 length:612 start_codon:yes stop_codon:yes gene_type:complete